MKKGMLASFASVLLAVGSIAVASTTGETRSSVPAAVAYDTAPAATFIKAKPRTPAEMLAALKAEFAKAKGPVTPRADGVREVNYCQTPYGYCNSGFLPAGAGCSCCFPGYGCYYGTVFWS